MNREFLRFLTRAKSMSVILLNIFGSSNIFGNFFFLKILLKMKLLSFYSTGNFYCVYQTKWVINENSLKFQRQHSCLRLLYEFSFLFQEQSPNSKQAVFGKMERFEQCEIEALPQENKRCFENSVNYQQYIYGQNDSIIHDLSPKRKIWYSNIWSSGRSSNWRNLRSFTNTEWLFFDDTCWLLFELFSACR